MKTTIRQYAVAMLLLASAGAPLGAAALPPINNDMAPPCWRSAAGSTVQKWTFTATNAGFTAPNLWASDTFTNPNGTPHVAIAPGQFGRWLDASENFSLNATVQGVWNVDPDGGMTFTIPNSSTPPAGAYKYVTVQMTEFYLPGLGGYSTITVTNATQVGVPQRIDTGATNLMGFHWIDSKTVWRLASSPASETIGLTPVANGNTFDAVIVDTLVVAPPAHTNVAVTTSSNSQIVAWASLADGCIFTNEVCTPSSGSSFAVGTNVVNCTLADLYGQTTPSQFKVTVAATVTTVPPPRIAASDTNIVVSWPQDGLSYALVKAGVVSDPPAAWSPVGIAAGLVGGRWQVTIPMPPTNTFYRLRYP